MGACLLPATCLQVSLETTKRHFGANSILTGHRLLRLGVAKFVQGKMSGETSGSQKCMVVGAAATAVCAVTVRGREPDTLPMCCQPSGPTLLLTDVVPAPPAS